MIMAMFEQMRANVGKLLKGIDRSELGWRARSGQEGWRRRGASQGWPGLHIHPGEEFLQVSLRPSTFPFPPSQTLSVS